MKRHFDGYRRLARGVFGASSLWLGPGDLLYVNGTGVLLPFAERYQRFELSRVQSASLAKTRTGLVLNGVYGAIALVSGSLGATGVWEAARESGPTSTLYYALAVPFAMLAGLGLVLFIINAALGPTCEFQIQTATRLEKVRAVRRLRTARRVLAELAPAIAAAQPGAGASIPPIPAPALEPVTP